MTAIQWTRGAWGSAAAQSAGLVRVSTGALPLAPLLAREALDRRQATGGRTKLWELAGTLHCSVIGTCLSTGELRHVLRRLGQTEEGLADHAAHKLGVGLAGQAGPGGKLLHKALDERHRAALRRFAGATDEGTLRDLWREAMDGGDIPGSYWAVLTHPQATPTLIAAVFGDVHMLSHLVGAANRADIRRLQALETERTALAAKVARQEARLRALALRHQAALARVRQESAARAPAAASPVAVAPETAELAERLARETARRRALEARLEEDAAARRGLEARCTVAEQEAARLRAERDAAEALFQREHDADAPALEGRAVLYVGGRPQTVVALREVVSRLGGSLLHHDGGLEASIGTLPGLVSRADLVVFPVDCISHTAAGRIKLLCRQMGRVFVPLRGGGVAAFLAGVRALAADTHVERFAAPIVIPHAI